MTTYRIQFFNHSGIVEETTAEAFSARQAIEDVLAREKNILRVTRAVPAKR